MERASGTWFQAFLPFVQVGETFGQIALTFANMSRALAETNIAPAEVVYQAETEIQAARAQATALGQDPTPVIKSIIADAQAMVSALSAKFVAAVGGPPSGGAGFQTLGGAPAPAGPPAPRETLGGHLSPSAHSPIGPTVQDWITAYVDLLASYSRREPAGDVKWKFDLVSDIAARMNQMCKSE
ncbi:hypothetical protein FK529_19305 [Tsukamurella asaccharolytica]|uniref:Uncharacterized protein n=1 Tax=Tsukamurella asaccharolytica TaxID=2592067 RepID=A0A5C5R4J1_9ACTN|nr:hypothetical protein [Tsukamurella asaccharolytica]TWS17698.1 hypothetical protein FK529_19305 [Tsukamurella asaccharolytica]